MKGGQIAVATEIWDTANKHKHDKGFRFKHNGNSKPACWPAHNDSASRFNVHQVHHRLICLHFPQRPLTVLKPGPKVPVCQVINSD